MGLMYMRYPDDPELWKNQPVCLPVVGLRFHDEELIAVSGGVDGICNGTST